MMLRTMLAATTASMIALGAQAADLKLMTGPQGGVWVPLGGQLKEIWEQAIPGTNVQPLPGAGIANVRGIEEGKADVGFGNSISTVDGLAGNAPFNKPHTNVCNVATLYPQYFQMLVPANSGIEKVTDLKGKAITTQPRGNTGELITQQLLKAHGMSYDDVKVSYVSYTDSVEQMKDGHAQAFTLGTAIPSGAVMDLASARDVKLLDLSGSLPEMKKMNPGYTLVTVPKNTYPKQDSDVKVIGYATHLVASCDLPEDVVYKMTKAVADNVSSLAATSKAISGLTPKEMAEDVGVPFHPGAAKFYKEQGISVQAKSS
ncbi:TAXI family TRAP transporter solute-binding subunit [Microvirga lenta]|uniref:TAXI family TRAP transporter solute-binding subunit n=1 Tax=Microvirga lenta TaxID=2881337 RepID=UPI001CFFCDB9|nr:TAXI family TRAP transporter solute-binding subunit [Microvirga lenta]MCB5176476.1 TAXI family TRAP transporter solute-binding subunit [Microvirga lenta]